LQEPHRAGCAQRVERLGGTCPAQPRRAEQRRRRHIENLGDALQPPGAEAAPAITIPIDLLNGEIVGSRDEK
jgi:hypothetical protein